MSRKDTVIGLDIGRYSAKAAWVERKGSSAIVTRTELLKIPAERSELKPVLKQWIEKCGIHKYQCVLGISGQQTIFQPVKAPTQDPRTPDQIAEMEVIRFNEMASETMIHGYTPFLLSTPGKNLLLAMSRSSVVEETLALAKELKVETVDVVPMPVALFNAMQPAGQENAQASLYINIGHAASDIAIGRGTGIVFARALGCGGQLFTDAIARAAGVTAAQADSTKTSTASLAEGTQYAPVLAKAADIWFSELQAGLSVFRSIFQTEAALQPKRVVLSGGGSEIPGFPEYIAKKLGIEVTRANSLPGVPSTDKAVLFTAAAGLAMSGLAVGMPAISLLPGTIRDEMIFKKQKPFWIAACVAAALILVVSVAGGYYDATKKERLLSEVNNVMEARKKLGGEIDDIKAKSETVRELARPVRNLMTNTELITEMISLLARSKSSGDSITSICNAEAYFNKEVLSAPPPQQPQGKRERRKTPVANQGEKKEKERMSGIIIEGLTKTYNLSTVKTLITKLNASPLVESADLLNDDKVAQPDGANLKSPPQGSYRFAIEVKFKKPKP